MDYIEAMGEQTKSQSPEGDTSEFHNKDYNSRHFALTVSQCPRRGHHQEPGLAACVWSGNASTLSQSPEGATIEGHELQGF